MAIAVPVLVLLAFGMLEFGLAFASKLELSQAVNQATRHATVMGREPNADIEILDALDAGFSGDMGVIDHVDIFRADANGDPVEWNRYLWTGAGCEWFPCPDPSPGPAVYGDPADYPPCERVTSLNLGTDMIGVRVQYTHEWISGVLGLPDQTWHETARARLEPDVLGIGSPPC